jgi:NADH:ubiquinone oxidoreductase subunit 6 (subunit J)
MRQSFGTFVLTLASLFGIVTAWLAAMRPGNFAARLGLAISNAGGINEVRAQYAGFFLAVSLVCIATLFGGLSRQTAFIVLIVVFAGLISGRLVSLVLNHGTSGYPPTILALYAIDSVGLLLSLIALKLNPS